MSGDSVATDNIPPAGARPRLGGVDLLRGWAALAVVWFHASAHLSGNRTVERWSSGLGEAGVFTFFAISGFLIPYVLNRGKYTLRENLFPFLLRRIVRLDPPYFASMILGILVIAASNLTPDYRGRPFDVTPLQTLLHIGYLNGIAGSRWIIGVYWTLSIEFQFYLLIGLTFPLLASKRVWVRRGTLGVFCALSMLPPVREFVELHRSVFVLQYLAIFATGILAFHYYSAHIGVREYLASNLIAGTAATFSSEFMTALFAGLLITVMLKTQFTLGRLGAFFATISYSLYLTHVPIVRGIVHLGSRVAPHNILTDVLLSATATLIAIAFAYCFYRAIEAPSIRWSQRISQSVSRRNIIPEIMALTQTNRKDQVT